MMNLEVFNFKEFEENGWGIPKINDLMKFNLEVPNYQREYCWTIRLIKDLVKSLNNSTNIFPGMIHVVKRYDLIDDGSEQGERILICKIVDGQQRITSIKLIEVALMILNDVDLDIIIESMDKLNVHKFQADDFETFKEYIKDEASYDKTNIYIRNYKIALDSISELNLNKFEEKFNNIQMITRIEEANKENELYLTLNNNGIPLHLEEKHRAILLVGEKNNDLIDFYRDILVTYNDIESILGKEANIIKYILEFLFIDYYEEMSSQKIGSFDTQDTQDKIVKILLEIIKTKADAKVYMKQLNKYLKSVKIAGTNSLNNFISTKLFDQIKTFRMNIKSSTSLMSLIIYDLHNRHTHKKDRIEEDLVGIIEDILLPYSFNSCLLDIKPYGKSDISELAPLYRNYFTLCTKNKREIFDLMFYQHKMRDKDEIKSRQEMINYIASSDLEYRTNSNIRKALSYLYGINVEDVSLEHGVPQSFLDQNLTDEQWAAKYNDELKSTYVNIKREDILKSIYSIGNYSLLDISLNSTLGNKSPIDKAKYILDHDEISSFSSISMNHTDAKKIIEEGVSYQSIIAKREKMKDLIIRELSKQDDLDVLYAKEINEILASENKRKEDEAALNHTKLLIQNAINFDVDIISNITSKIIIDNLGKGMAKLDKDTLVDKLKLDKKYSRVMNKAIENELEGFFEEVFNKKITKQFTIDQLYIFVVEILNNDNHKVEFSISKTIEDNSRYNSSNSFKRKWNAMKNKNTIIENSQNNIRIIGKLF